MLERRFKCNFTRSSQKCEGKATLHKIKTEALAIEKQTCNNLRMILSENKILNKDYMVKYQETQAPLRFLSKTLVTESRFRQQ